MLAEFRDFVARGNVLDLAVAVIIGAAFATITTSLTDDVIMPVVGWLFGGLDFSNYFLVLQWPREYSGPWTYEGLKAGGAVILGWGQFVTVLINFLILAFIIFLLVRWANRIAPRPDEAPAAEPADLALLREIRDELHRQGEDQRGIATRQILGSGGDPL